MKKYLKLLVALLCVMACILSLASCGNSCPHTNTVAVDESVAKDPIGIDPGMTAGKQCADCGAIIEQPHEFYRISFIYSRKAMITDASGTKVKNVETEVFHVDFAKGNNGGFTAETEAALKAMDYHGYSFIGWHTGWNQSTQTPDGVAYPFPKQQIDRNAKVYVERGNYIGENVTWALEPAGSGKNNLVISGTGPMFDLEFCDGIDIPWYIEKDTIVKVIVNDGVTTIGSNVFAQLAYVTEVDLADTITSIGTNAFLGDKKLKNVTMPASLTIIKENAFKDCVGLKSVVLNEGLKTIEQLAFYGDRAIVSVVVPRSLEKIGNGAFHPGTNDKGTVESHALKKLFYLGASEAEFRNISISMDNKWFADFTTIYCFTTDAATGVTGSYWFLEDGIPVQYTVSISYKAGSSAEPFAIDYVPVAPVRGTDNKIIVDNNGNVKEYSGTVSAANITFRQNLSFNGYKFVMDNQLVEGNPFNKDLVITCDRGNILSDNGGIIWTATDTNADNKKDKVVISIANADGSMRMWDFAYANDARVYAGNSIEAMNDIKTIIINEGVTYIGKNSFAGFINVTEIHIPASVTEIHPEAFSGCTNLVTVYYDGDDLADCENITALRSVPAVAYAKATAPVATEGNYWMTIGGKTIAWSLNNGTLTVGGDNDMMDFASASAAPWYGAKDSITSVVIATNVINVGQNIVNGYANVTTVKFHNKIKDVAGNAFEGTGLVNNTQGYANGVLVVDGVLLKVDANSAANAELFKTFKGILVIADGAFDGCENIKKIYIVKGISYVNADAFSELDLDVVYFEAKAAITNANVGMKITADEKYFYSPEAPDPAGFYYDAQGNFKLWKNG